MNPFDWRGPQFLAFYLVFAVLVLVGAWLFRRMKESGPAPKMNLDPYAIAYLRGGENEAVRVALVSLIDRGLLTTTKSKVVRASHADPAAVRHPIEQMILKKLGLPREASDIFKDASLDLVCAPFQTALQEHALLPDTAAQQSRREVFSGALALLLGVGGIKVFLGLSRDRPVVILVVLMVVVTFFAWKVCFPRITARGQAMLEDLRALYAGLRLRAATIRAGGTTIDAAMLAAVFGIGLLPAAGFGYTRTLFPQAASGNSSTASCGSSCGSSCGGGGCGGGCGGCGS